MVYYTKLFLKIGSRWCYCKQQNVNSFYPTSVNRNFSINENIIQSMQAADQDQVVTKESHVIESSNKQLNQCKTRLYIISPNDGYHIEKGIRRGLIQCYVPEHLKFESSSPKEYS